MKPRGTLPTNRRLRPGPLGIGQALLLLIALGGLGAATAAAGDDKACEVNVLVIRATKGSDKVSPELKSIESKLRKQFPQYKGFKLEGRRRGSVKLGQTLSAPLVENYRARVTPLEKDRKRVRLRVEFLRGDDRIANTTLALEPGRYALQSIGLPGEDALVVGVSGE